MRATLLGCVLCACGGIAAEDFAAERQRAYCDRLFECAADEDIAFPSIEVCYEDGLPTGTTTTGPTCTFDPAAAKDCVNDFAETECSDILLPYFQPESCDQVCV